MIQRIQTLFLLVVVILSVFSFFIPSVELIYLQNKLIYLPDIKGIILNGSVSNSILTLSWALIIVTFIMPIIAIFSIFSFKNRKIQIRLCVINMIFMIAYYVFLCFEIWTAYLQFHTEWHLYFVAFIPLINLIFSYLAIEFIRKDEKLIKSLDRLR